MDEAAVVALRALDLLARRPFTGRPLRPRCGISLPSEWLRTRLNLMQILGYAPWQEVSSGGSEARASLYPPKSQHAGRQRILRLETKTGLRRRLQPLIDFLAQQ